MNAGATVASGGALVFLHADVILPEAAYSILQQALHDPALIGGAFRRRFDSPSHLLALGCRLADLRGRWNRIYLGDQAIFVRREVFERLGGFSEALLFEDLDFSLRMRRMGRTRLIEEPVLASSRRFEREGNGKRLFRNLFLTALYLAGADPNRLARRYYPGYYSGTEPATPEAARIPR